MTSLNCQYIHFISVCKDPPYKVEESGYAGFILPIEVYFKNKVCYWTLRQTKQTLNVGEFLVITILFFFLTDGSSGRTEESSVWLWPVPPLGGPSSCQSSPMREAHLQKPNRGVSQKTTESWRGRRNKNECFPGKACRIPWWVSKINLCCHL